DLKPPMGQDLLAAASLAFRAPNLLPATQACLAVGFGLSLLAAWLRWVLANPHRKPTHHVRGATFAPAAVLRRMADERTLRNRLLRVRAAFQFAQVKPGPRQVWNDFWREVPQATVG